MSFLFCMEIFQTIPINAMLNQRKRPMTLVFIILKANVMKLNATKTTPLKWESKYLLYMCLYLERFFISKRYYIPLQILIFVILVAVQSLLRKATTMKSITLNHIQTAVLILLKIKKNETMNVSTLNWLFSNKSNNKILEIILFSFITHMKNIYLNWHIFFSMKYQGFISIHIKWNWYFAGNYMKRSSKTDFFFLISTKRSNQDYATFMTLIWRISNILFSK